MQNARYIREIQKNTPPILECSFRAPKIIIWGRDRAPKSTNLWDWN